MIETEKMVKVVINGDDVQRFIEICELAQQHMDIMSELRTRHRKNDLREFITRIIDAEL